MSTLGCDPEFTIFDKDNNPVPAHAIGIPPSSSALIDSTYDYDNSGKVVGKIFRDGYNVEVNVPPGACRANMNSYLRSALVKLLAPKLPAGHTLRAKAAFEIPLYQMYDAPEDVRYFGCSPSLDAYTGAQKIVNVDPMEHPWRYAGGHLHFGSHVAMNEVCITDPEQQRLLVRLFDKFIGIPLAVIYNDSGQWQRRKLYGQAGEYRNQKYTYNNVGVEYRVPPSELFNHPAIVTLFTGVGRKVISNFNGLTGLLSKHEDRDTDSIIRAINTGEGAEDLLGTVPGFYNPNSIKALAKCPAAHEFILNTFTHDPHDGWTEHAREWKITIPSGGPISW